MSFMTEKRAKEIFSQYMQAEASGNDTLAIQLERDLNSSGWVISSGPDGLTVNRKDGIIDGSGIDWFYAPKDGTVAPTPGGENPNAKIWRNVGIGLLIAIGLVLIIVVGVKIYRTVKNKQSGAS